MNNKGQIEVETILGLIAVLFIFVGVMAITSMRNAEIESLSSISSDASECRELSSIISFMGSSKYNSEITISISNDINLFADHVSITGTSCDFFANASPSQLYKGAVRVYESGGLIYAENV